MVSVALLVSVFLGSQLVAAHRMSFHSLLSLALNYDPFKLTVLGSRCSRVRARRRRRPGTVQKRRPGARELLPSSFSAFQEVVLMFIVRSKAVFPRLNLTGTVTLAFPASTNASSFIVFPNGINKTLEEVQTQPNVSIKGTAASEGALGGPFVRRPSLSPPWPIFAHVSTLQERYDREIHRHDCGRRTGRHHPCQQLGLPCQAPPPERPGYAYLICPRPLCI